MGEATYAVSNFLGGEISQFAQGRFDRPDYRVSLNVCLNSFPVEIGAWTRRPGTQHGGTTRACGAGRTIKFDFEQSDAVTLEFTDGFLRFRNGAVLITTNDTATVAAISTANPAVVQLSAAATWVTGNTAVFSNLGVNNPLLQNRRFILTKIDTTHFSLADEITGATIDGSMLGAFVSGNIGRVHELTTVYATGLWSAVRVVQAETTAILLSPTLPPQALTVSTLPTATLQAQFEINPSLFNDGPYLDPFTNGVQASLNATSGIVTLQLSFSEFNSDKAYASDAFVTSSGINYVSLIDQNVGNTPVSSPSAWAATTASAAINNGQGFLGTDIGRLVRLFSEPPAWDAGTTYGVGSAVSYNPSGEPGATVYYTALVSNAGNTPGTDLTNWAISPSGVALWTWGKIVSLSNIIDRSLSGSTSFGDMNGGGGLNSPFDGQFSQNSAGCAQAGASGGLTPDGTVVSLSTFVGKNYSGASAQQIKQATVYPSADKGLVFGTVTPFDGNPVALNGNVTLNLRASNSLPSGPSNGTLLGTTGLLSNHVAPSTITSSDQTTAWNYVWIEIVSTTTILTGVGFAQGYSIANTIGQLSFFAPTGTGTSAGVDVEILGPALLRTTAIVTWRLGAYSYTTGWPTCGCYDDGRIWLGGAIANRFDASTSNGLLPGSGTINFAPTDQFGNVADSNAISETINADSVNPLYWMIPDLQGILIGTQAGEFLLLAPNSGSISPSNITARRSTTIGSSDVEPRRTEHTIAFVKRYGRKLMEYFADVFSGKFSAPNLAERAQHIPRTGIAELAYTEAVTPILWGRNNDGSLFGVTYKRDALTTSQGPTYAAWHRHALGSGRVVESICAGPSVGGDLDTLTMVTNDPTTSLRHVELLTDTPDELTDLADWWFLDDAVNPSSITVSQVPVTGAPYGGATLNGLWHLNGQTVQVFAGGLDCGDRGDNLTTFTDFLVTNGSVFVPFGDQVSAGSGRGLFTADFVNALPLSQIVIGFTYDSDGQIVRRNEPAETGARNGPALGKLRRNHRYSMLLSNSLGVSVGAAFTDLYPAAFKGSDGISPIDPLTTFSGVHQDSVQDDYSYDGMLCWRVSRPFAANVVAIAGNIQTQDQ